MPVKNAPLPVLIQDRLLHRFEGDRRITDPLHTGAEAPGGYVLVHGIPMYMTEDIGIRAVDIHIHRLMGQDVKIIQHGRQKIHLIEAKVQPVPGRFI